MPLQALLLSSDADWADQAWSQPVEGRLAMQTPVLAGKRMMSTGRTGPCKVSRLVWEWNKTRCPRGHFDSRHYEVTTSNIAWLSPKGNCPGKAGFASSMFDTGEETSQHQMARISLLTTFLDAGSFLQGRDTLVDWWMRGWASILRKESLNCRKWPVLGLSYYYH